jgi:inositol-phosphate phosphatase / L-galactose 1-phosphate phosphatase / histidinol-phosphatase
VIRPYFRTVLTVDDKADLSPVTAADRAAERTMRQMIAARFPAHGIIGEEYGRERDDAEFVWVLDPIDGTKSFISGMPLFGTLIALARHGKPILGIIDQPISRERWIGVAGRSTTHNGLPVRCRPCPGIAAATVFATTPEMFKGDDAASFSRVAAAAKLVRYGADCYAYGLVALGFVDIVIEASLNPYDFSAMLPIIEGAGGIATDWQGNPLGLSSDGRVLIAGDRRTHSDALALLTG